MQNQKLRQLCKLLFPGSPSWSNQPHHLHQTAIHVAGFLSDSCHIPDFELGLLLCDFEFAKHRMHLESSKWKGGTALLDKVMIRSLNDARKGERVRLPGRKTEEGLASKQQSLPLLI